MTRERNYFLLRPPASYALSSSSLTLFFIIQLWGRMESYKERLMKSNTEPRKVIAVMSHVLPVTCKNTLY
jgi:hypothetical protein